MSSDTQYECQTFKTTDNKKKQLDPKKSIHGFASCVLALVKFIKNAYNHPRKFILRRLRGCVKRGIGYCEEVMRNKYNVQLQEKRYLEEAQANSDKDKRFALDNPIYCPEVDEKYDILRYIFGDAPDIFLGDDLLVGPDAQKLQRCDWRNFVGLPVVYYDDIVPQPSLLLDGDVEDNPGPKIVKRRRPEPEMSDDDWAEIIRVRVQNYEMYLRSQGVPQISENVADSESKKIRIGQSGDVEQNPGPRVKIVKTVDNLPSIDLPEFPKTYNEGIVKCEFKWRVNSEDILSIPINNLFKFSIDKDDEFSYFRFINDKQVRANFDQYEFCRIMSVRTELSVFAQSKTKFLMLENIYQMDAIQEHGAFDSIFNRNDDVDEYEAGMSYYKRFTDAWRYLGCHEAYDGTWAHSKYAENSEKGLFMNLIVEPQEGIAVVSGKMAIRSQFYSRIIENDNVMRSYYSSL